MNSLHPRHVVVNDMSQYPLNFAINRGPFARNVIKNLPEEALHALLQCIAKNIVYTQRRRALVGNSVLKANKRDLECHGARLLVSNTA